MAISLIPSGKKVQGPGKFTAANIVGSAENFVPSIIVFVVVGALYLGSVLWIGQLETEVQNIEVQKEEILALSRQDDIAALKQFARKARALDGIVAKHSAPSALFDPFEESVHSSVFIRSFILDVLSGNLAIEGTTQSFETLGEQFVIWRNTNTYLDSIDLAGFTKSGEGQVDFSATMKVKPEYLKPQ
ncbi:MAG: hypothetical protein WD712_01490 [Candidatus Spechtbacterales bacterium]